MTDVQNPEGASGAVPPGGPGATTTGVVVGGTGGGSSPADADAGTGAAASRVEAVDLDALDGDDGDGGEDHEAEDTDGRPDDEEADGDFDWEAEAPAGCFDSEMPDGMLVLHYEARDVTIPMDGLTALRAMAMFAWRPLVVPLSDGFASYDASIRAPWLVFDVLKPLAMSWRPDPGPDRFGTLTSRG